MNKELPHRESAASKSLTRAEKVFLEMTAPRQTRDAGTPELVQLARQRGVLMMDGLSGLSEITAKEILNRLPPR